MRTIVKGLIAGAAGTSALNLASYLDMLVRGRAASTTPEQAAGRLAERAEVSLGEGERAESRKQALGALLGYGTGAGAALGYALLTARRRPPWPVGVIALTALAMLGSNGPLTALGVTDPREWPPSSWVADVVPHLAYGITAYAAYAVMSPEGVSERPRTA